MSAITGLTRAQQPERVAEKVYDRIGQVYLHVAAGFAATCTSAFLFAKAGFATKVVTVLMGPNAVLAGIGLLAIGIALIAAIHFTSTENSFLKKGLFGLFSVYEGLLLSPLVLINAPVFAGAALATVGITGGLGALALKMQNQFERLEKILQISLGVVAAASLGSLVLPGVAGVFAHQVSLIGGFALFSALVIYDTQKIKTEARTNRAFDVVEHTMAIYLDAMNLLTHLFELMNRREENNN